MSTFTSSVVKSVLVVIAMEAEAAPLLEKLSLEEVSAASKHAPFKLYTGTFKDSTVTVVTNGKCQKFGVDNVGTTPAALSTFLSINQFSPDLVINAGTAGGFARKGAAIGDAFISTGIKNHDRRIPIPGFTEYGIGDHLSLHVPNLVESLGLKSGVVTTSNSLDHTETDDRIMLENDASVKDMEAASVAWAADLSGTPYIALKVVTDIVDGDRPSHEEFMENLGTAAKSLQETVPRVIDFVLGKELASL